MDPNHYVSYNERNGNVVPPTNPSSENKNKNNNNNLSPKKKSEKPEDEIWNDIVGKELIWDDMTQCQKIQRVIMNTLKILCVFGCLYFFVCSLDLLSSSFRLISGKSTGAVMNNAYVSNPVVGLMIGILVTVLVQSSSTSTSIIVSMVASGILNVHDAIPMIMGSNIGTSVTNTIVSLTQVGDREQYRRAFAGATVHDMFNWLNVIVLLSLEVVTGMLENLTTAIMNSFSNSKGIKIKMLDVVTEPFTDLILQLDSQVVECWGMGFMLNKETMIKKYCRYIETNNTTLSIFESTNSSELMAVPIMCQEEDNIGEENSCQFVFYESFMSDRTIGIILLLTSLTILCSSLICIVKLLNSLLKGSIAKVIQKVINADIPYVPWLTGYVAIVIGAFLTFIVQSSSVFTSTITPLIGIGMISVERAYPLTLGSNLGTTTTALLAAMAAVGDKRDSIQIALVHSLFNIFGILLFYPIPALRWPIPLCKALGDITSKYRWFAVFYLVAMFFVLPGTVFALSLGGTNVLWGVLGPILLLLTLVILLNLIQHKAPQCLPETIRTWHFLPEPLRSLDPYDRVFMALPCCAKCQSSDVEVEDEIQEVITDDIAKEKKTWTIGPAAGVGKQGIDNPIIVVDFS